jgi:hypothetical protein
MTHNTLHYTMLVGNIVVTLAFLMVYTFSLEEARLMNYSLSKSTRALPKKLRSFRETYFEADCNQTLNPSLYYLPPNFTTTLSGPETCKCIDKAMPEWLLHQLQDDSVCSDIHEEWDKELACHEQVSSSNASALSFTETFDRCMWAHPRTTTTKWNDIASSVVVVASLLNWNTVIYTIMSLFLAFDNDKPLIRYTLIALAFAWHATLFFYTIEDHKATLAITFALFFALVTVFTQEAVLRALTTKTPHPDAGLNYLFLMNYATTLPIVMFLYNASHFHLDLLYTVISSLLMFIVGLITTTAINYGASISSKDVKSNIDHGLFTFCNFVLVSLVYSIVPREYPFHPYSYVQSVTPLVVICYTIIPLLCSFDKIWKKSVVSDTEKEDAKKIAGMLYNNEKSSLIMLFTVMDFILRGVVLGAAAVDLLYVKPEPQLYLS